MDMLFKNILCFLCLFTSTCHAESYKAAIIHTSEDVAVDKYSSLFYEASKMNADILVLPTPELPRSGNDQAVCIVDKYDEIVESISDAARTFRLYVVAHLLEKIQCQGVQEVIRNSLVFDREGSVVSVYRKPLQVLSTCNISNTNPQTFATDFGVTFGLLMEEDLVLKNPKNVLTEKNFVVTGKSSASVPLLSVQQFSPSWSYVANANLISSSAIYAGKAGLKTGTGRVIVAELSKDGGDDQSTIKFNGPTTLTNFPGEDLSQHTIRPLDISNSVHGYYETVCHNKFCCDFHLKTSLLGNPKEINYGLVAFNGVQHYDRHHSIEVQSCALVACVGLYKRSCFVSSENTTNIVFDELYISGNFARNSVQFPILQSTADIVLKTENFVFDAESTDDQKHVTAKIYNTQDVLRFGIFSRDYSNDFKVKAQFENINKTDTVSEASDYISSDNVQEFFDYLWIRLRILLVVVSIYVLEMM